MESWPEQTPNGVIEWRNRAGEKHRVDGPAVEHPDGSEEWYQHGVLHRSGGPAVYSVDGFTAWYQQGQLHRDDGPARQWALDGPDEFWRHGIQVEGPATEAVAHGGPASTTGYRNPAQCSGLQAGGEAPGSGGSGLVLDVLPDDGQRCPAN